jgi:hypothetical protein
MAIFQVTDGKLTAIAPTTFAAAGIRERSDIQQLLKQQIDVIAPDTIVIAEEFGEWEDSRRRIDLLAIDKNANLVVIELKRTEDGGHMELQALRYAAMVSTLTFDKAVDVFASYLSARGQSADAKSILLEFLDCDESEVAEFPTDVRIILAAAEFSKEITTTVMWLNDDYGLDIQCVRLRPYNDGGRLLIDVQQVIPLPEAASYQIQLREKKVTERAVRTQNRDFTRYDVIAGSNTYANLPKRRAIYHVIRALCDAGVDPEKLRAAVPWKNTLLTPIPGTLDGPAFQRAFAEHLVEQGNKPQVNRYYIDEEDLIHANGKTYAATKMWGGQTLSAMDQLINAFPNYGISYRESRS